MSNGQWSRTQEVERDLGAGQRALGVSGTQPGMDGNTQQVRQKEDGLRPKPGTPPCTEQVKKRSQVEGDIHQTLQPGKASGRRGSRRDFSPQTAEKSPPPLCFCISLSPPNTPAHDTPGHLESPLTTLAGTDMMSQWRSHCFFSWPLPPFSTQQGPPTDRLLFKEHSVLCQHHYF